MALCRVLYGECFEGAAVFSVLHHILASVFISPLCSQIKVNFDQWYKKNPAELSVKPIYKTLPNAKVALDGTTPEPRFIWKEKDWPNGFPDSPEEAKTDVMTYLEQRDCYHRLKKLDAKDFSVGSIVAVTRADPYIAKGKVRCVI